MTDLDRFKAAADALADLVAEVLADDRLDNFAVQEEALTAYRAARAAIETPQTKDQPHD